jgi:cytochrome c5
MARRSLRGVRLALLALALGMPGVSLLGSCAGTRPQAGATPPSGTPAPAESTLTTGAPTPTPATTRPVPSAAVRARAAAMAKTASAMLPAGPGHDIAARSCTLCHSAMLFQQQAKDSTSWEKTLALMEKWGAPVQSAEHDTLRGYLVGSFGPRPLTSDSSAATPPPAPRNR